MKGGSSSSSSSSRIYYFDWEGPTDVAVLLQGTLSALYRAKRKRIDAQHDDTRQAENSTYQRQGKVISELTGFLRFICLCSPFHLRKRVLLLFGFRSILSLCPCLQCAKNASSPS